MISAPRGLQNGVPGGGPCSGGAGGPGTGGGVAGCGTPCHGYIVFVVTSTMPSEFQYQSWGTFHSQLSTDCPEAEDHPETSGCT